jgi:peptidoglycan/LPS O-acetylase OafA/YrhL
VEITERQKYTTLNGLRGIAAIAIAIRHCPHFFVGFGLPGSFLSVDLFFVLSGFVISMAYEDRFRAGMTTFEFMRLRLIRLYPLYLLGVSLGLPVAVLAMYRAGLSVNWSPLLLGATIPFSAVMLPTPPFGDTDPLIPLNPVLWSIFFELAANILFAAFYNTLKSTKVLLTIIGISGVAVIFLAIANGTLDGGFSWGTMPLGFARVGFSFFLGVLGRRMTIDVKRRETNFAFLPVIATLIVFRFVRELDAQIFSALVIIPLIILFAARFEPRFFKRVFDKAGDASYALYVIHKPAYQLVLGFLIVVLPMRPETLSPWIGIAYITAICVAAIIVDYVYDTPVRKWLTRAVQNRQKVAVSTL